MAPRYPLLPTQPAAAAATSPSAAYGSSLGGGRVGAAPPAGANPGRDALTQLVLAQQRAGGPFGRQPIGSPMAAAGPAVPGAITPTPPIPGAGVPGVLPGTLGAGISGPAQQAGIPQPGGLPIGMAPGAASPTMPGTSPLGLPNYG